MSTHVIIIDPYPARFGALGQRLRRCGFQVSHCEGLDAARPLLALNGGPALTVVDERCGATSSVAFFDELRRRSPTTTSLWVGDLPLPAQLIDAAAPSSSCASDPHELIVRALELLRPRLYPNAFVDFMRDEYRASLDALFGEGFTTGEVALESAYSSIAGVSAMVSFTGRRLSGWLLVAASFDTLTGLASRLLPDVESFSLWEAGDVAGEIANQLLGRIKVYFTDSGLDIELGSPVYLCGEMIRVRYPSPRPSLTLPLRGPTGTLWSELHVNGAIPKARLLPPSRPTSGELNFL